MSEKRKRGVGEKLFSGRAYIVLVLVCCQAYLGMSEAEHIQRLHDVEKLQDVTDVYRIEMGKLLTDLDGGAISSDVAQAQYEHATTALEQTLNAPNAISQYGMLRSYQLIEQWLASTTGEDFRTAYATAPNFAEGSENDVNAANALVSETAYGIAGFFTVFLLYLGSMYQEFRKRRHQTKRVFDSEETDQLAPTRTATMHLTDDGELVSDEEMGTQTPKVTAHHRS